MSPTFISIFNIYQIVRNLNQKVYQNGLSQIQFLPNSFHEIKSILFAFICIGKPEIQGDWNAWGWFWKNEVAQIGCFVQYAPVNRTNRTLHLKIEIPGIDLTQNLETFTDVWMRKSVVSITSTPLSLVGYYDEQMGN